LVSRDLGIPSHQSPPEASEAQSHPRLPWAAGRACPGSWERYAYLVGGSFIHLSTQRECLALTRPWHFGEMGGWERGAVQGRDRTDGSSSAKQQHRVQGSGGGGWGSDLLKTRDHN
jgi:hypothetical protein